jgi:hypothetical protein
MAELAAAGVCRGDRIFALPLHDEKHPKNIQETSLAAGIATMSTRLRGHVVVFDEIDPVAIEKKKLPIDPDPRPTIVYTALGFGL